MIISQSRSSAIPHYFPIHFVATKFPPREPLSAESQIASAGGSVFRQKKNLIDFIFNTGYKMAISVKYKHVEGKLFPLTRALEGGGAKNAHPSGFSRIAEKRRRAAPPFFQYLLTIEFDTLCKNFSPRSPKVRSPGQVKVKNGFLTLRLRSGHTRYPIGFKPSAFHKVIDTYNLYISNF